MVDACACVRAHDRVIIFHVGRLLILPRQYRIVANELWKSLIAVEFMVAI